MIAFIMLILRKHAKPLRQFGAWAVSLASIIPATGSIEVPHACLQHHR